MRALLIPLLRENVHRHADLAEFLEAQIVAQGLAHPAHHRAQNRFPLLGADVGKHHADDRMVLVPAGHIGLPGGQRQGRQNFSQHSSVAVGGQAISPVQQHEHEGFPERSVRFLSSAIMR